MGDASIIFLCIRVTASVSTYGYVKVHCKHYILRRHYLTDIDFVVINLNYVPIIIHIWMSFSNVLHLAEAAFHQKKKN